VAGILAHGLFPPPTTDFFRPPIPEGDLAIQISHHDGVGGELQQRGLFRDRRMGSVHFFALF
jgi:hypothetical protein